MTQQELKNWCFVTGYLSFIGCLTLKFDTIVSGGSGSYNNKSITQPQLQVGGLSLDTSVSSVILLLN